jgi:hypothetical protein
MTEIVYGEWVVTPWRRYRIGWFGRVILEVEEKRKIETLDRWQKRWRDAVRSDLNDHEDVMPFVKGPTFR